MVSKLMWFFYFVFSMLPFYDLELVPDSLRSEFSGISSQMDQGTPGFENKTYLPTVKNNFEKLVTMEMIQIPAGEFWMGCDPAHNGGILCYDTSELPLHLVYLDAYSIDKTEVTNAQYMQCVLAGECAPPISTASFTRTSYFYNPEYVNYPVIFITWTEAQNYCNWDGKRLPTEAEWEKAARGPTPRGYPWGDSPPSCDLGNYNHYDGYTEIPCTGDTTKVGSYPDSSSPYGVLDMMGNVWEWVSDWSSFDYYGGSPYANPTGPETGTNKILRGGSFYNGRFFTRTSFHGVDGPINFSDTSTGIRCVSPSTD